MKTKRFSPVILGVLLCLSTMILGYDRSEINFSIMPSIDDNMRLKFSLDLLNHSPMPIREVRIYYREFSEAKFHSLPLKSEGLRYLADVDLSDYRGSMVEYFVDIEYGDGSRDTYPSEAPETNLFRVAVQEGFESDAGLVVISPEPNEEIFTDEFILMVTFFEYSGLVDKERTKIYLDTWDVSRSRFVKVFEDFVTFAPKQVPPGRHKVRLELFDQTGKLLAAKTWFFTALRRRGPAPTTGNFNYSGQFFAESRNEELVDGTQSNTYNKTGLRFTAGTPTVKFGSRIFISNQEKSSRQPINRYTGWLQWNFWNDRFVRITGGDAYPRLNPYLLQNIFVRGVYGQVYLKFINLDVTKGFTQRAVEGSTIVDTSGAVVDTSGGMFKRNLWSVRASFGARKKFQLGFTAVKGKDDVNSIRFGSTPEENFGVGTDLFLSLDNERIIFEGSANASSYNPNILDGKDIELSKLKDAGFDISDKLYDLATKFITVNQYLIPIPGLAFQGQLRLNYYNNSFSVLYKYVQDNFHSLGQPYLLRDNKGFTISDNIRLLQNQLFLNLRYQQYENNLTDTKPATTTNRTLAFMISYFPMQNFPSINFGFNNYQRDNGINDSSNPIAFPEDNVTNTINFSTSYNFLMSNLKNRLTITLLNYNRKDNTVQGIDNLSNTLSLLLKTQYNNPLTSFLQFNFQQTDNTATVNESKLNLGSFGGGLDYRFKTLFARGDELLIAASTLYGKVSSDVTTTLNNTSAMTSTDYNRLFLNGRLIYSHQSLGRITINADLVNYTGDRSFKDYIITARYDLSF